MWRKIDGTGVLYFTKISSKVDVKKMMKTKPRMAEEEVQVINDDVQNLC